MLTFSQEQRALSGLSYEAGFDGGMSLRYLQANEMSCFAKSLSGSYIPLNSITNGRLTIRVASVEATTIEIDLKSPEDRAETRDATRLIGIAATPLSLSQFISSSRELAFSHADQRTKVLSAIDQILLTESGISTTEAIRVEEGKMTSEAIVVTYQQEQKKSLPTQQALDLFNRHIRADKNLSANVFQVFANKMMEQYPLIQSEMPCATLSRTTANKLCDVILSRTYSSHPAATQRQFQDALKTYGRYSFTNDVIKMLALSIAAGDDSPAVQFDLHYELDGVTYFVSRKEPLKIIHCQNATEAKAHQGMNRSQPLLEVGGYYSPEYNVVVFEANETEPFSSYFIHEASHATMHFLFKNKTKPYNPDDANQKNTFEQAALSVFKNVAQKLGIKKAALSTLHSIPDIVALLKRETMLDLIECNYRSSKAQALSFMLELRNKYGFAEDLTAEKLEENIINKLKQEIANKKLKPHDLTVLSEFAALIYDYPEEEIEEELIVRLPQLLAEKVPSPKLKSYFNPLMKYWNATVTPAVSTLYALHQARCREAADPKSTPYLIEEYLTSASNKKRKRS